ncbi:hypothetical protein M9978_13910 [Sphingomonas sp. MG17]|uniref:Uncharacterized protein n=1 Tax=Sphingomonas tagetis TaxID=2949092 RepID=A0A9X2HLK8_9SPHN|nr:hypothetical protein [Sphingomonas tagetis]MCP3731519.1 hypothetical protein [Sphingomonas tagetis]
MTQPKTIAPEVIACIAEGRYPSVTELNRVADRIWSDLRACRPALFCNVEGNPYERLLVLKAAQAALAGDDPTVA